MNWEEQKELWEKMIAECFRILTQKGPEYAGDKDALGNFKEAEEEIGTTTKQVWGILARKHWRSITHYVKHGKEFSEEPIEGRIHDMINYLFLLLCLITEEKEIQAIIDDVEEREYDK